MKKNIFLISLLPLVFSACTPKTTVVLLDSGKSKNAIIVSNEKGEAKIEKVGSYVNLEDKAEPIGKIKMMSKDELNERFSKVLAMSPMKALSYIVYFEEKSTELTDSSKLELEEALKSIKERSPCLVDVIGHTDTTGSNAINLKVSLKRAKRIEALIKESKIEIISLVAKGYGEEELLVQTEDNTAEAKNRNVEIFIK